MSLLLTAALAAEPAAPADKLDQLVLSDGQVLVGQVKAGEGQWSLTLVDGTVLRFDDEAVKRVDWDAGEVPRGARRQGWNALPAEWKSDPGSWPDDPDGDRYLLWPSGRSVGQGRGSLSQREVAATILSYNITDQLEVSAGAVVPLLFVEYSRAATAGVRLSARVGEHGFGAIGVQGLILGEQAFAAPHAALGVEMGRFTLTLGGGAAIGEDPDVLSLGMLGASVQVSPRVWLLTESWLAHGGFIGDVVRGFPSFSARMITRRVSFDAGVVVIDRTGIGTDILPMPVFSVAWHFPNAVF